jgi:hypothetical protein
MGTSKYRALADASDGGLLNVIKAAKPQSLLTLGPHRSLSEAAGQAWRNRQVEQLYYGDLDSAGRTT